MTEDKASGGTVRLALLLLTWLVAILSLALPYLDIEQVRTWGGEEILWLQDQGSVLTAAARAFSYLGDDIAYIIMMPILLLGVSYKIGAETFVLFFTSMVFNNVLKTLMHGPRPSWTMTAGLVCEIEYGNPSFHSQAAFTLYPFAARLITLRLRGGAGSVLVWGVALLLASGVAASRCVLGAHFPHQVLDGSLLGLAIFLSYDVLRDTAPLLAWAQVLACDLRTALVSAGLVSLGGCGLGVAAWGITKATFTYPASWAERGEAACADEGEKLDDLGGVKYTFLAVGLLASVTVAHGAAALPMAMLALEKEPERPCWHACMRGLLGVLAIAVVYVGVGELVSKSWPAAVVLLLRYYLRGLLAGLAGLWLMPLLFQKLGWLPQGGADAGALAELSTKNSRLESD